MELDLFIRLFWDELETKVLEHSWASERLRYSWRSRAPLVFFSLDGLFLFSGSRDGRRIL